MKYLIGRIRIGACIGGKLTWDKYLPFFDDILEDMKVGDECIINGKIFDNDINPNPKDFMEAFNILLKLQTKSKITINSNINSDSYTYNIAKILGINIENIENIREGIETKKIGNTYTLACPYYIEGEKINSKFGYFKGDNTDYTFIENNKSSKILDIKITEKTDIKELKRITETKKDDVIKIKLDDNVLKNMDTSDQTDLILILNKDNVKVNKRKETIDIEDIEDIDFKPNKNFYIKMLISIIKNKDMSDNKRKMYMEELKSLTLQK